MLLMSKWLFYGTVLFIAILITGAFSFASASSSDEKVACEEGLGVCNGECYDPFTHRCVTDQLSKEQNVCRARETASCNGQCYDPTRYKCFTDIVTEEPNICLMNHGGSCNGQCFNTLSHRCVPDDLLEGVFM